MGRFFSRGVTIYFLAMASVALISTLCFINILNYPFTDSDDLCFIDSVDNLSARSLGGVFTHQLYTELDDLPNYNISFYRPLTKLLFFTEFSVWDLNPSRYHLTDIAMHAIASILALLLLKSLSGGRLMTAWLGASLFASHPLLVELIPSISRRSDIVFTMFILLTLFLFDRYYSSPARPRHLYILSVITGILALGSKELALILPGIVLAYCLVYPASDSQTIWNRIFQALKLTSPFIFITILYFSWRLFVIGGAGGYWYVLDDEGLIPRLSNIFFEFLSDVFVRPVTVNHLTDLSPGLTDTIISITVAMTAVALLIIFRRAVYRMIASGNLPTTFYRLILFIAAMLSFFSILSYYVIVAPFMNDLIQNAYNGKGPEFFRRAITVLIQNGYYGEGPQLLRTISSSAIPLDYYLLRSRNLFLDSMMLVLLLSVTLLFSELLVRNRQKVMSFIATTRPGKTIIFSSIWLLMSLLVFLISVNYLSYYAYIGLFPITAVLSISAVKAFDFVTVRLHGFYSTMPINFIRTETVLAVFLIVAGVSISGVSSIPFDANNQWKEIGEVQTQFFEKLTEIVPSLPNDAIIEVDSYPRSLMLSDAYAYPKQPGGIWSHTIKCWLNLHYPGNQFKVVWKDPCTIGDIPPDINVEVWNDRSVTHLHINLNQECIAHT